LGLHGDGGGAGQQQGRSGNEQMLFHAHYLHKPGASRGRHINDFGSANAPS